jgi:hypothetical protein
VIFFPRLGENSRDKGYEFLLQSPKRNWKDAKIIVFDALQIPDKPYSHRIELLKQSTTLRLLTLIYFVGIPKEHPILSVINPILCQGRDHLEQYFKQVCIDSASPSAGVVLRDPTAWYYKKDSFFIKKVSNGLLDIR